MKYNVHQVQCLVQQHAQNVYYLLIIFEYYKLLRGTTRNLRDMTNINIVWLDGVMQHLMRKVVHQN